MYRSRVPGDRGISPVIGVILMVAIVVILAAMGAYMILGLSDEEDPQPNVVWEVKETDSHEYLLVHDGGDSIDGEKLRLGGVADPDVASGSNLTAGDELAIYPTDTEIELVWTGDRGTSYVLQSFTVEETLPAPDEDCDWVDSETNGGSDPVTVDSIVVDCTVQTDGQITLINGGAIVGDGISNVKDFDADSGTVYGDVTVESVLNLQDGEITGAATSDTADVKIGNGTVGGPIEADKVAEIAAGSTVEGDVRSHTKDAKVLDSTVEGSITADGIVKLDSAVVTGDVYVDPADFDCTDSTINGEDCSSYSPKDPADW